MSPKEEQAKRLTWLWALSTDMTNDPGDMVPKEKNSHSERGKGKSLLLHRLFTLYKCTKEAADIQFNKDIILTLKVA